MPPAQKEQLTTQTRRAITDSDAGALVVPRSEPDTPAPVIQNGGTDMSDPHSRLFPATDARDSNELGHAPEQRLSAAKTGTTQTATFGPLSVLKRIPLILKHSLHA